MVRLENANSYARATPAEIMKKAGEIIEKESQRAEVLNPDAFENIPLFRKEEIQVGKVVGRGGFAAVREITAIHLMEVNEEGLVTQVSKPQSSARLFRRVNSSMSKADDEGASKRELLTRQIWSKRSSKYVVKEVEPTLLQNDIVTYLKGVIDLGLEAHYLASLSHNNILKLRGMAAFGPSESLGFFIILDELSEVLPKRLNRWMHQKRASNGITGVVTGGRRNRSKLLMERVLVAYDIADGMDYIHRKRIVFRDLKHDNIGFDADNILKIFDFGLAKELHESDMVENGLYRMTGLTGALRYMAPENGLQKPYNQKVDVYSWSMLMWYILALEPPLGAYTTKMFIERVFEKGYRPAIKDKWPQHLKTLLRRTWDESPDERPSFDDIKRSLRAFTRTIDPEIASMMVTDKSNHASIGRNSFNSETH